MQNVINQHCWRAMSAIYLDRVPKAQLIEAVTHACCADAARLEGKRWLLESPHRSL